LELEIARAARLLTESRSAVALTGAGLSTRSGIPDFRGPGGLWASADAPQDELLRATSIYAFGRDPHGFYERMRPFLRLILEAEPNPAHRALADLEARGYLGAVITQNGDMLHQRAGSQNVIEVHGTLARATCIQCYQEAPGVPLLERFLEDGELPRCRACAGAMKPNVILTGEQLPRKVILAARQALRACDLLLIAGTSLPGGPVSDLPELARQHGARLVVVNLAPTLVDSLAEVVIRADVVDALPALAAALPPRGDAG
jgi:NAD-dependent deacetylase